MKAHKFIFFFTLLFATVCTYAQEITPSDTPNETQKAMLKRGYGMFIHFGVNTFSGDEWSDGTVPVSAYNPTRLDCDQWVRVARDAGFRYALHQASLRVLPVGQQINRLRCGFLTRQDGCGG